ncbi:uncharacterized protein LOC144096961 [Amblyomma americanum]
MAYSGTEENAAAETDSVSHPAATLSRRAAPLPPPPKTRQQRTTRIACLWAPLRCAAARPLVRAFPPCGPYLYPGRLCPRLTTAVLMENLLLWFIMLTVIAACGIFGLWLLCNVRSYLGNNGNSSNQMRHPLFADEQQQPQSPTMDPREQHHQWRPDEQPQPFPQPHPQPQPKTQPQPLPFPPFNDQQQQQQRNGHSYYPYYIEPPIDYTPPPTAEPPRKHTVCTQTYQSYAKKKTVKIEQQRSPSLPE